MGGCFPLSRCMPLFTRLRPAAVMLLPQVLVLKAYLKACRLNEVNSGGLSSYSLTNMVIAHLQEELKVRGAARWRAGNMREICLRSARSGSITPVSPACSSLFAAAVGPRRERPG